MDAVSSAILLTTDVTPLTEFLISVGAAHGLILEVSCHPRRANISAESTEWCVHNGNGRGGKGRGGGESHVTTTYDTQNRAEGERERVQGSE